MSDLLRYRSATATDVQALAVMNHALIRDEGHRNAMNVAQLAERMAGLLAGGYEAVLFEEGDAAHGYALFRREAEWVYLRQFYVRPAWRRRGVGREAIGWLRANVWRDVPRLRLDVLVGNVGAIAFWRAVGFADYCLTMKLELPSAATDDGGSP